MEVLAANHDRVRPPCSSYIPSSDVLCVDDLSVIFQPKPSVELHALRGVSFSIAHREIVGLLGESGCGKTTTALAILQLLHSTARVSTGSIQFHGTNLLTLDKSRLREIRGFQISMIYQDSDVLNPVMRVGDQILEVLRAHRNMPLAQMRDEVYSTLCNMGFENCDRIYRAYPHQLSGGERRRISIAQALVCKPRLVIADEPTAWLDFKTTSELLALFAHLKDVFETSFLLISHDPDALNVADRVIVMYAGQVIESGTRSDVLLQPKHPYTRALLECRSYATSQSLGHTSRRLPYIPGSAPDPLEVLSGCSFLSRCSDRMKECESHPPELVNISISSGHCARCLKYRDEA